MNQIDKYDENTILGAIIIGQWIVLIPLILIGLLIWII